MLKNRIIEKAPLSNRTLRNRLHFVIISFYVDGNSTPLLQDTKKRDSKQRERKFHCSVLTLSSKSQICAPIFTLLSPM